MVEKTVFLVGDIGGTNSRLELYDKDEKTKLIERHYKNCEVFKDKSAGSFERFVLEPFLKECWSSSGIKDILPPIESTEIIACLACAGIVRDNKVVLTNLGGVEVNGNDIEKNNDVNIPRIKRLLIINDFVAQGYGCLTLKSNEVEELTEGSHDKVEEYGPKVCVGAGTGLGECFLTWNGNGYKCYPSEGGHTEFNPRTKLEIEMRENLMKKFGYLHRLSIERVVSGMGLADVYEFLASAFKDRVDSIVHDQFLKAENEKAKIVADNCGQELCKQALDIMMSAYGSEVGSSAIKWIPTGGLYVSGGVTLKNIEHIRGKDSQFMKGYLDKGRVSDLLSTIPLFLVLVDDLGLRGALEMCTREFAAEKLM